MVFVQKWPLFQPVFLGNIGKENVFHDILPQKKAFLGYKNKKFKNSKNWHFSKGVNLSFWSNKGRFSKLFFLGNIGKENVFHDILEHKKACLGYKKEKFKKSKNWHFSMVLVQQCPFFQIFFFSQYRPGKCLLRYFTTK